ncbi:MAG TPA: glycosyltransferase family 4 protein [Vicinamibacterales bacterium]|jgi:glycosyltransferase involved in cell wall biosynthesis|nr:glycosyltransferase family 4 protein [Vicinamibacterales bacterium]
MKLAAVIHRFGTDFAGGSEGHCRAIMTRLAAHHDITVLTTCAKDHITWANEYPEGASTVGPLKVVRFPVVRQRSMHRFADISDTVFSGASPDVEEEQWFRENGPEAPALLEHVRKHGREYDRVFFWSFRYYQSFFGLPIVPERSILVPTAEEDPVIRMRAVNKFFPLASAFLFLTPEERDLVAAHSAAPLAPYEIIGSGLEPPAAGGGDAARLVALGIRTPFVLYLGRIDPNKGCETLLRHFLRFLSETGRSVQLVMAGPVNMPLPEHPLVKPLGFVDEAVREGLLSSASVLVVPSPFESLSLALLEAWNHGLPALVNGRCAVLKGQATRANGGLYYLNFDEFSRELTHLLDHPEIARDLGMQGRAYVEREYRWPNVIDKIERFLATVAVA